VVVGDEIAQCLNSDWPPVFHAEIEARPAAEGNLAVPPIARVQDE